VRRRLIRRLAERHVPLAETRERLGRLSLAEARALLAEEEARAAELERATQAGSPRDYLAGLLEGERTPPSAPPPTAPKASRAPLGKRGQDRAPKAPPSTPPGAARLREVSRAYQASPPSTPHGEGWRRWELAPGVELLAREDTLAAHQGLIERVLDVAHPDPETRER
jgi:hypothetical protein